MRIPGWTHLNKILLLSNRNEKSVSQVEVEPLCLSEYKGATCQNRHISSQSSGIIPKKAKELPTTEYAIIWLSKCIGFVRIILLLPPMGIMVWHTFVLVLLCCFSSFPLSSIFSFQNMRIQVTDPFLTTYPEFFIYFKRQGKSRQKVFPHGASLFLSFRSLTHPSPQLYFLRIHFCLAPLNGVYSARLCLSNDSFLLHLFKVRKQLVMVL